MEDKTLKRAIETAGCWFVAHYIKEVLDNFPRLEMDRAFKKSFTQTIFEKEQRDRTIGGTQARVSALMKVVRMNKVNEAMEYIIQSKRLNQADPKSVETAKEILKKLCS